MQFSIARDIAVFLRDQFSADGISPVAVNSGLCADFADSLEKNLVHAGLEASVRSLDDFWADDGQLDDALQSMRDRFSLPIGLSWDYLSELNFRDLASHSWVETGNLCFDAEAVDGVSSPFDLPCVRHVLVEVIGSLDAPLLKRLTENQWWSESLKVLERRSPEIDSLAVAATASPHL